MKNDTLSNAQTRDLLEQVSKLLLEAEVVIWTDKDLGERIRAFRNGPLEAALNTLSSR